MKKIIILVDDDETIHLQTKVILEKAGYDFISAFSADDGFEKIKVTQPDLIILDYLMPEKSGIELYKQLRENISGSGSPR